MNLRQLVLGLVLLSIVLGLLAFSYQQRQNTLATATNASLDAFLQQVVASKGALDHDMPGQDLASVPRIPNSIRLAYQERNENGTRGEMVIYQTPKTAPQIFEYYRETLAPSNWTLTYSQEQIGQVVYRRGDTNLVVLVRPAAEFTLYSLVLSVPSQ